MPVPYAVLELFPMGGEIHSDASGAFQFSGLQPGVYQVVARKTGFQPSEADDPASISLTASKSQYVVKLTPLSVIRGKVADENGEGVEGATVVAIQSEVVAGRRRSSVVAVAQTNDRGEYRMSGFTSGQYRIRASGNTSHQAYFGDRAPPPESHDSFRATFFGGAHDAAGAASMEVRPGVDARADIAVNLEPGHAIRGRLVNYRPNTKATLLLSDSEDDPGLSAVSLEYATGRFEIHGVPDGQYRLRAYQNGAEHEIWFAEQAIVISGRDVEHVELSLAACPTVKGVAESKGSADSFNFTAVLRPQDVWMQWAGGNTQLSAVGKGTFEIPDVVPGKYQMDLLAFNGYISSARAGDIDLLATRELVVGAGGAPPIEVVLRPDGGQVTGTIASLPRESAGIVLLAPEACNRPAAIARFGEGGFSFYYLAPGAYRLYAWQQKTLELQVEYASPAGLCDLARGGTRVVVEAGRETKVQLPKLSEEAQ